MEGDGKKSVSIAVELTTATALALLVVPGHQGGNLKFRKVKISLYKEVMGRKTWISYKRNYVERVYV